MRAGVRHRYGPPDVLSVEEIPTPVPFDDEVRVRVHAASANLGDWELLRGDPLFIAAMAQLFGEKPRHPVSSSSRGLLRPKHKILGCDFAGRIDEVGRAVTQFRPGDAVFGMCGFGAFAEYVCVKQTAAMVPKPAGLTFEQAATLPQAAFIALQGIRDKARVKAGHEVLINGAGGGAGALALQYAKSLGANVTAVDNGGKSEMMLSIGADHVVDYETEDYTQTDRRYDVVFDLAAHRPLSESRRVLKPDGVHLVAGGAAGPVLQAMLLGPLVSKLRKQQLVFLMAQDSREDLVAAAEFIRSGKGTPVIDRCYRLDDLAQALQRMGEGRALGKVVITM